MCHFMTSVQGIRSLSCKIGSAVLGHVSTCRFCCSILHLFRPPRADASETSMFGSKVYWPVVGAALKLGEDGRDVAGTRSISRN